MLAIMIGLALTAHAGKLADGFRGIPYGDVAALSVAPSENCSHRPEPLVEWYCQDKIGQAEVQIAYVVDRGLFFGVHITAKGWRNADALLEVAKAAWGDGRPEHDWDDSWRADRLWSDGNVGAKFEYNQFSEASTMITVHMALKREIDGMAKAEAAKAVNDL